MIINCLTRNIENLTLQDFFVIFDKKHKKSAPKGAIF